MIRLFFTRPSFLTYIDGDMTTFIDPFILEPPGGN